MGLLRWVVIFWEMLVNLSDNFEASNANTRHEWATSL